MPTYEYQCDGCGHTFEKFQSMSAPVLRKCPNCGQMQLKRLIGAGSAVIFKGSGFYETDYRSDNYKKAQTKEKPKVTDTSDKKDAAKSETTSTSDKKPAVSGTKPPDTNGSKKEK